jgi:hypothetical protein
VIGQVADCANVDVDPHPLERAGRADAYSELRNRLRASTMETGSLGVTHCVGRDEPPARRETTLTVTEVVGQLYLASRAKGLEYQLTVPEHRGRSPILDRITRRIDPEVWIEDNRRI